MTLRTHAAVAVALAAAIITSSAIAHAQTAAPGNAATSSSTPGNAIAVQPQLTAAATASAAQQPPIVSAPSTPPPPAPIPVGLSGQVTPWLQLRGEFRNRSEGFSGGGFKPDSSDAYTLDRFRFNVTVTPTKTLKFVVQAQDARTFQKEAGSQVAPFRDTFDLKMAYGEIGNARGMVRGGRQELNFGEGRLIGALPWTNVARSFDGVRGTITRKKFKADFFGASVVVTDPEDFNKSGNGNQLYGFYGSSDAIIAKGTVEPYFYWRQSRGLTVETGGAGDLHQSTLGVRTIGKLPKSFDYGVELATQMGSVESDDVQAWAGHFVMGKTFTPSWKPRAFAEFNYASGDSNAKDGTRGTFDQLYPTGHDKLGLSDQVGWRNIEHLRGGVDFKPLRQLTVSSSYHTWWLANAHDALYNAAGTAIARSADGSVGRHVGHEFDTQATFAYSPQLLVSGGYAFLNPSQFLKATTPGENYNYSFLMITYVFVGERPASGAGR